MVLKDTSIWGNGRSSVNNPVVPPPKPPQPQPATGGAGTHTAYEMDPFGNRVEVTYDATGKVIGSKRMNHNLDGSYVTPGPFSGFGFRFSSSPAANSNVGTQSVSKSSSGVSYSNAIPNSINTATERWKRDQSVNEKFDKYSKEIAGVSDGLDVVQFTNWLKKNYSNISDDDFNPYYLKELYDKYRSSAESVSYRSSLEGQIENKRRSGFATSMLNARRVGSGTGIV